jgi:hypothetical protein
MFARSALAILALSLAAPLPVAAQSYGTILDRCANAARNFFGAQNAPTDMRYNGARADGTETVGGEIYVQGRAPYISCAFRRGSGEMIEFFVDGQDQSSFVSASAGVSMMPVFSAQCPQNNFVESDGTTVRVNGRQAQVTPFNRNYYEARAGNVIYIISTAEGGGDLQVTYDPPGSRGGSCTVTASGGTSSGGSTGVGQTDTVRVQFPAGSTGTELSDNLAPGASRRYVLGAQSGQFIYVRIAPWNGNLEYQIFNPDNSFMLDMTPARQEHRGQLWQSGDHVIEVINRSNQTVSYNAIFGVE